MSSPLAPVPGWNEANAKLQQLLISDGLYSYLELTDNDPFMHQMLDNELYASFDLFCPYCKMVTTYQIKQGKATNSGTASRYVTGLLKPNVIVLNAVCLRINHLISVVLYRTEKRLIKIGQYPSMADLALGELKDVAKSLNPVDRKELGRALGLFAHDAPLGAFVYLRRVFERMILRAHGRHVAAGKPEVENFAKPPGPLMSASSCRSTEPNSGDPNPMSHSPNAMPPGSHSLISHVAAPQGTNSLTTGGRSRSRWCPCKVPAPDDC